jgi:hypothetical protein
MEGRKHVDAWDREEILEEATGNSFKAWNDR